MHYFHCGDPIDYYLIHPDGSLQHVQMGNDFTQAQQAQLLVPGGVWKASRLSPNGDLGYGLIGESVAPGFDYQDMQLGDTQSLSMQFPQHAQLIGQLSRHAG